MPCRLRPDRVVCPNQVPAQQRHDRSLPAPRWLVAVRPDDDSGIAWRHRSPAIARRPSNHGGIRHGRHGVRCLDWRARRGVHAARGARDPGRGRGTGAQRGRRQAPAQAKLPPGQAHQPRHCRRPRPRGHDLPSHWI